MQFWQTSRFDIDLQTPKIMGIVNVTPDSFSDGGLYQETAAAIRHAELLLKNGVDILDIGAESTRPGSPAVAAHDELARLLPVLKELVKWQVPISVDTYKAEVMAAALDMGADIINDVWALRQPRALDVVQRHARCGVCLMHMHGDPQTMHRNHMQGSVLGAVRAFFTDRVTEVVSTGVNRNRIVLDPGFGFGKSVADNFALLANQKALEDLGLPLLAGWSRKGSLGTVTGRPVEQRMVASVAAAVLAVERGARIVRVHDVAETTDALKVWCAMQENGTR